MDFTVVTYGGGEILKNVFEAIAMLSGKGKHGIIYPLATISLAISGVWIVFKCFFSGEVNSMFSKYLFPIIAIIGLLLVPTSSVHIEDILKNKIYKVDHVPLIVGKISEVMSSIGYQTTKAIESVMHTPNDSTYSKTGMIFGAENALNIQKYQITDGDFEQNMREFTKQCMTHDISLGFYSIADVQKSTDLWTFLETNTAKSRGIMYRFQQKQGSQPEVTYLSCKDAVTRMKPYFNKEKEHYAKQNFLKNLPLTYQALTKIQTTTEELVGQQLMICFLKGELNGLGLGKERAHDQQRTNYHILGSLASTSLVTMRAVLEALIYSSIILVLPMSLLPGGLKFVFTWLQLLIWIQFWPPFYAILHYVMQIVAQAKSAAIFTGVSSLRGDCGLSIFTSAGIIDLHDDIHALAGYLSASIPFISYAIIQGGVGSFIHLASSMMTPAHAAAGSSASEAVSGNYSFANASVGQKSYHNESQLQVSNAPSLSSGYFSENTGDASLVHLSSGEKIYSQNLSKMDRGISSDFSTSQSFQRLKQDAESLADTTQKSYSESQLQSVRQMADFTTHLSDGKNYNENISERESSSLQESARYVQNIAKNVSEQWGLSEKDALDFTVNAGLSASVFGNGMTLGASQGTSHLSSNDLNACKSYVENSDVSESLQKISDFASSKSASFLNDEGRRYSEGLSESLDHTKQLQESFQMAHSRLEQISSQESWVESQSDSIRKTMDQEFINWASGKYESSGGFYKVKEILNGNSFEADQLVGEFLSQYQIQEELNFENNFSERLNTFSSDKFDHSSFGSATSPYKDTITGNFDNHYNDIQQSINGNQDIVDHHLSNNSASLSSVKNQMEGAQQSARGRSNFDNFANTGLRAGQKWLDFGGGVYQTVSGLVGSQSMEGINSKDTPLFFND